MCQCKPGVTGTKCDQCMDGFYGLDREGCKPCNCDMQGSLDTQCDVEGKCMCKEGVQGDKCDKCALNHFDITAGCKKCDACYNLVEHTYNNHKNELGRLRRVARELSDEPTLLNSDAEFNEALEKLSEDSRGLEAQSEKILAGYTHMIQDLSDAGQNAQEIQRKLEEFASSLETCENDVNGAKVQQTATDGTIKALKNSIVSISEALEETAESITAAEEMAEDQKYRHDELYKLAQEADDYITVIQSRSEEVQQKAAEAKETADRARQQITESMEKLKELKNRLQEVGTNDVKAALTRISEAKKEAEKAKDNAQQARDKALDILSQVNKIEIPNLDLEQLGLTGSRTDGTQNIEKIAKEIENEADVLEHKLEVLLNEFDSKKQRLENSRASADRRYKEGKTLLDQADRLMAMVHGAKQEAQSDNDKINALILKAEQLYNQLNKFHNQFHDSLEDVDTESRKRSVNIPDIRAQLQDAEKVFDKLSDHAEQLQTTADKVYDDASAVKNNAQQQKEASESIKDQANALKDDIEKAAEMLQQKNQIKEDFQDKLGGKEKQIKERFQEAEAARQKAQDSQKKAQQSKENLETLLGLIEKLKSDKLIQMLAEGEVMADDYINCKNGEDSCLKLLQAKLSDFREQFEDMKAEQQENISVLQQNLQEDKGKITQINDKKKKLITEVETLEKIRNVLPNWCRDSSSNEND